MFILTRMLMIFWTWWACYWWWMCECGTWDIICDSKSIIKICLGNACCVYYTSRNSFTGWGFPTPELDFPSLESCKVYIHYSKNLLILEYVCFHKFVCIVHFSDIKVSVQLYCRLTPLLLMVWLVLYSPVIVTTSRRHWVRSDSRLAISTSTTSPLARLWANSHSVEQGRQVRHDFWPTILAWYHCIIMRENFHHENLSLQVS